MGGVWAVCGRRGRCVGGVWARRAVWVVWAVWAVWVSLPVRSGAGLEGCTGAGALHVGSAGDGKRYANSKLPYPCAFGRDHARVRTMQLPGPPRLT